MEPGLLQLDNTEGPTQIVTGTGGKEQLVGRAIVGRTSAELNSPELVDGDGLIVGIFDLAHNLAIFQIKGIDGSSVGIV